jgi:hypothetical protein
VTRLRLDALPPELRAAAATVATYFETEAFRIFTERPVAPDAPLRTTLLCQRGRESILVEVQTRAHLGRAIEDLARWLDSTRQFSSLFLAVPITSDVPGTLLQKLKQYGVGLLLADETRDVQELVRARVFSLLVPVVPNAALGPLSARVCALGQKFNDGDRKEALREMFDLVELENGRLARRAATKNWITKSVTDVDAMDWSTWINVLAAPNCYAGSRRPLFDGKLKDDLHSFRGARNLIDHPAPSRRADERRRLQYHERMIQGPRILGELLRLKRRIQ